MKVVDIDRWKMLHAEEFEIAMQAWLRLKWRKARALREEAALRQTSESENPPTPDESEP